MKLVYSRPSLKDLTQGSRIAFARQFRLMTQDDVSRKLGINSKCRRRTMTRYEKGERNPIEKRTRKIADILNVNYYAIKNYDYKEPEDFIYILLWLEELYPNYRFDVSDVIDYDNVQLETIKKFLKEWEIIKNKRRRKEIRYSDYIEWKLTYTLNNEEQIK